MTSNCATLIKDSALLSHLSSGDFVALTGRYNRARAAQRSEAQVETKTERELSRTAFGRIDTVPAQNETDQMTYKPLQQLPLLRCCEV